MRQVILFLASLLLLLILPSGFQEARAEARPFCIKIKWWRSADSDLTAAQRNMAVNFASVNGKDLDFYWIPGSEQPPFPNGRHDASFQVSSSLSQACFPRSFLLPGKNLFALKFGWDTPSSSGNAEANMSLSNGQGEIFLCRESIQAGGGGEHGCKRDVALELSQIDPELAAKVSQLASVNERLARELDSLQGNYKALKAFMDALEKRLDKDGKSLFDTLTEGDFKGFEPELVEVLNLIRSHKTSVEALKADTNKVLADAKADGEAVRAALEDALRRDGATIDDVSVSVPEIGDLEIPFPEPEDQTDPFDPANDPYDKIANATIELIQRNWPDRRFEILASVNAWNQKQKDMEAGIAARTRASPAEIAAYRQSIRKVSGFILETGCDGKGCLTEDGWFTDTLVPPDVRRSLKAEIRAINPVKAELLEEQMRMWKRDEANQKMIIAGVQALTGAARTLGRLAADDSAYLRGRLDAILTSTITAAKNGVCLAGRITPGVNDFGDWYEAISGKDACSGKTLENWERVLSGVGIIAGSGKLWRTMGEEIAGIAQVARNADGFIEGAASLKRYGPLEKGPLHLIQQGSDTVADTFRSSSYFEILTKEDIILYRVYDTSRSKDGLGAYWSRIKPSGPLQAQIDSALNPNWKTVPKAWVGIKVPKGTKIFEGAVGPQIIESSPSKFPVGSLYGGGSQVYLDLKVQSSWIQDDLRGVF